MKIMKAKVEERNFDIRHVAWASVVAALALPAVALTTPIIARPPTDGGKPAALMGFGTDVAAVEKDVLQPGRYAYESFVNRWVAPKDYAKYSVLYFGEKLRGDAKGKNWLDPDARAAAEAFFAAGGVVLASDPGVVRDLLGKPKKGAVDPLLKKITVLPRSLGRLKANYAKAKKKLGFADDVGDWVLTDEGRAVKELTDAYAKAFAAVPNLARRPEGEKWIAEPLGAPGDLKLPDHFEKMPKLGKMPVRQPGLLLFDGTTEAAVVADPKGGKTIAALADELAWHLAEMTGRKVGVQTEMPDDGRPVLLVKGLPGDDCRAVVSREGNVLTIAGVDAGVSHALTYVLEALGCRYLWPGKSGKIIPKKSVVRLPEIALDWKTPFVVRRMRLYGRPLPLDREGNRDFFKWYGMNDTKYMTDTRPGPADGYQWGHYFGNYYARFKDTHPEFFALQPDGTRDLRLGTHSERPTFCLSNPQLVEIVAKEKIAEFKAHPEKKALSICLPDGAAVSWCLCEKCRRMDPVNAAPGGVTVFRPTRHSVKYVAMTDRVFAFMNAVAERVAKVYPDKLLSTYAYSCYTAAPVRVKPHPNLLILSVAGAYGSLEGIAAAQKNLAAWASFGNKLLWRPNMSAGFRSNAPQNYGRHAFADVSVLAENGVFGTDFDTMYHEWAVKGIGYFFTARAHFNPDRLDYDTVLDDFCASGFGAGAADVRAYYDALERAGDAAAALNSADKEPALGWVQRRRRADRILETLDFDLLDRHIAAARAKTAGDAAIAARLDRLQFASDSGRWTKRLLTDKSPETKAAYKAFTDAYFARDPDAFAPPRASYKGNAVAP